MLGLMKCCIFYFKINCNRLCKGKKNNLTLECYLINNAILLFFLIIFDDKCLRFLLVISKFVISKFVM